MEWNDIKTEYITTGISYKKLAEKHGIPFTTLSQRGTKEHWKELRRKHRENIVMKSVKKAEDRAVDYKSVLYELAYKVARQLAELTDDKSVEQLARAGIKPRDITGAIKDLEDALHVKSDADLREQEARIAKLKRDAEENGTDRTVQVIIAGDAEKYSRSGIICGNVQPQKGHARWGSTVRMP